MSNQTQENSKISTCCIKLVLKTCSKPFNCGDCTKLELFIRWYYAAWVNLCAWPLWESNLWHAFVRLQAAKIARLSTSRFLLHFYSVQNYNKRNESDYKSLMNNENVKTNIFADISYWKCIIYSVQLQGAQTKAILIFFYLNNNTRE